MRHCGADGEIDHPRRQQPAFAEQAGQRSDQETLHRQYDGADESVGDADLIGMPVEPCRGEQREQDLDLREDEVDDAVDRDQRQHGAAELRQRREGIPPQPEAGQGLWCVGPGFAHGHQGQQQRQDRGAGGGKGGQGIIRMLRVRSDQQAAEQRTKDQADAEGTADQAHAAGALLGRGTVGDDGASDPDLAAADAGDNAGKKDRQEAVGKGQPDIADHAERHAAEENRAPADPVRQAAQRRGRQELGNREYRRQHCHREGRGAVMGGVERQQRQDQAETDQVDHNGEQQDRQHSGKPV